jgi:hypothetical protein
MSTKKATETAQAEAVQAETKTETAAVKQEAAVKAVAYLGPTIKGVAVSGTIYSAGLPEGLNEKIKEVPAIKGLLISVDKLAASSVAIQTEGTALNTLYKTVAAKLQ